MQHAAPADNGSSKTSPSLSIVLDSNILISGILYGNRAGAAVEDVIHNHTFITSRYIVDEVISYIKLVRPKVSHKWIIALQRNLLNHAREYDTNASHDVRDINDVPILQLAIEHNALIVTGDKDLLECKADARVAILSVAEYEELFIAS